MSRLSYFTIQSWVFDTQSKYNHSPKIFSNVKSKFKRSPKTNKIQLFANKNAAISPLTRSKSVSES